MLTTQYRACTVTCALSLAALCSTGAAATLCVNPHAPQSCYKTIQAAVNGAKPNDVIHVAAGVYPEMVTIGKPLSLSGARGRSIIDASGQQNGIFVDGLDHPGLSDVTISELTITNANFEGVLVVSASNVIVRDSSILDNDKSPGLNFTGTAVGCPGQPAFETDESGDCGGAIHLIGTANSVISGNLITGNADGILISDETAESHDNLIVHNNIVDNPLECGIVLASHPRNGEGGNGVTPPATYSAHFGVNHNTVAENVSSRNGVQIGGAGAGMFSDGNGMGTVSGNLIIANELTDNGLGGIDIHSHVGPSFHLPADNMNGNAIIGNLIAGNLADTFDTATPGRVGININSGQGGSPIYNTVISGNVIRNEDVDVAVNTPNEVHVHLNDLLGGNIGVAYVCALDGGTACTGAVNATENFWGCTDGPGSSGCSTVSGNVITATPFLTTRIPPDPRPGH